MGRLRRSQLIAVWLATVSTFLCRAGASGQPIEELRRRANIIDWVAMAAVALEVCREPPRKIDLDAARAEGLDPARDADEIRQVMSPVRSRVPSTPTHACLFLEENFGPNGNRMPNLVIIDRDAVQRRLSLQAFQKEQEKKAEAEIQKDETRREEAARAAEEERARVHSLQWRHGLLPMERACVDFSERENGRLNDAFLKSQELLRRGSVTEFMLQMVLFRPDRTFFSITCRGEWSKDGLTVKSVLHGAQQ